MADPASRPAGGKRPQTPLPAAAARKRQRRYIATQEGSAAPAGTSAGSAATVRAPSLIDVRAYTESKLFEIAALQKALTQQTQHAGTLRVFQTLPRHMRRRAASANPKRLPRRFRERGMQEIVQSKVPDPRPQMMVRRRLRRTQMARIAWQKRTHKHQWLETHVWHAKRAQMVDLPGAPVRIADHMNMKSARSTFRAARDQAVMYDRSYGRVLEIKGPTDLIGRLMATVTNPAQPAVTAARFRCGLQQGQQWFHDEGQWPSAAITSFTFIWRPQATAPSACPTAPPSEALPSTPGVLWLFLHPVSAPKVKLVLHKRRAALLAARASSAAPSTTPMTIEFISDRLNQFELIGPRAWAIVKRALQCWRPLPSTDPAAAALSSSSSSPTPCISPAWTALAQHDTLTAAPEGLIMPVDVFDPRLTFPVRMPPRTATTPSTAAAGTAPVVPPPAQLLAKKGKRRVSPLFSSTERHHVRHTMLSHKVLHAMYRTRLHTNVSLLSATARAQRRRDTPVPVAVIAQPCLGDMTNGRAAADHSASRERVLLLIPKGYGMAFWLALLFGGARVIARKEREDLALDAGVPQFPCDAVATPTFALNNALAHRDAEALHLRRPKSKRHAFGKLGTLSPFSTCLPLFLLHHPIPQHALRQRRFDRPNERIRFDARDMARLQLAMDRQPADATTASTPASTSSASLASTPVQWVLRHNPIITAPLMLQLLQRHLMQLPTHLPPAGGPIDGDAVYTAFWDRWIRELTAKLRVARPELDIAATAGGLRAAAPPIVLVRVRMEGHGRPGAHDTVLVPAASQLTASSASLPARMDRADVAVALTCGMLSRGGYALSAGHAAGLASLNLRLLVQLWAEALQTAGRPAVGTSATATASKRVAQRYARWLGQNQLPCYIKRTQTGQADLAWIHFLL
ncbi:hypothetical protein CXG81DRAFT_18349 [Caulochytrium protostelioides]|uniref:POP1-domain-containing protein n=1 Tax=Caulochytrium protostelioides TaxID=1555241 RepID=A0A4P9X9A7_9FUNG|nr:hypothetical protein CXG81DRAFT_18349 [Caulochytrium protostelioides]|eukprot:RKP01917.1 hypothetical protein CXG81DRAFT_18349 [Caulochytrium protostelioides]